MSQKNSVRTWDVPTRMFHWLLVILIINAYLTYKFGDVQMTYHMYNGYAILTLCLYRIFWGLFGSSTARFTDFIKGPKAIFGYLSSLKSSTPKKFLGHNPVGGLMVIALLFFVLGQGSMGLFSSDDIIVEGPLVFIASSDWVSTASSLHRIGFWVIVGFASLHIFAAFFYLFIKKENLIHAMVTGKKAAEIVPDDQELKTSSPLLALFFLILSGFLVWLGINIWKF